MNYGLEVMGYESPIQSNSNSHREGKAAFGTALNF